MLASLNNKNANENANEKAARRSAGRLILFWLFVFACVRCSVYKLLQLRKDEGAEIRAAAAAAGQSVSSYILQAVRERMQRERADESAED